MVRFVHGKIDVDEMAQYYGFVDAAEMREKEKEG